MGRRKRITKKGLKHDALLETTAKGTKFVEEHLGKVVLGVAAVVVIVVLGGMVMRSRRAAELSANADLMAASQTASAGLIEQAAQQYQEVADTYPGTRSAGAAMCYLGAISYHQKQYDEALAHFDTYLDRYGRSGTLGRAAMEGKAAVLEQRRDFLSAAQIFEGLAGRSEELPATVSRYLADALRCYRSANDWEAVSRTAARIVDEYPDTPWAGDARVVLAEAEVQLGL